MNHVGNTSSCIYTSFPKNYNNVDVLRTLLGCVGEFFSAALIMAHWFEMSITHQGQMQKRERERERDSWQQTFDRFDLDL